ATPALAAAGAGQSSARSAASVDAIRRPGSGSILPDGIPSWQLRRLLQRPGRPAPLARRPDGFLFGTNFLSASSRGSVGYFCRRGCSASFEKTLIERWNGSTWARVPSPDPGLIEGLFSVSAVSRNDAWAVGVYVKRQAQAAFFHTLILHWNGTRWVQLP